MEAAPIHTEKIGQFKNTIIASKSYLTDVGLIKKKLKSDFFMSKLLEL